MKLLLTVILGAAAFSLTYGWANPTSQLTSQSSTSPAKDKKLLYYSWDTPTPAEVVEKVGLLGRAPFGGVSFRHSGEEQVFTHAPLRSAPFEDDVAALQDIGQAAGSSKLSESFLRMQINAEDGWDWTSEADWAAFASNVRNYARVAEAGGLKGILFDPEPYGYNVWNYETQPARDAQSFEALEAKARERGADFVRILKEEYPGVTLLSLKMFSQRLYMLEDNPDEAELRRRIKNDTFHGLWYGFANGMIDALDENITLIDGNEQSYYYLSARAFDEGVAAIYGELTDAFVDDKTKYRAQVEVAHAAYVDGTLNLFDSPRFIGYYLANDEERLKLTEHNLYHGLRTSDELYWVYAEDLRWWSQENVPEGFAALLSRTKKKQASGEALGFSTDFIDSAKAGYSARVKLYGSITPNVPGVSLDVSGAPGSACGTWNNGARYTCVFPEGTSATVTPVAQGVSFTPERYSYQNLSLNNVPGGEQDYKAE